MGVQVYGIKSVMAWAENKQCPAWALFDGKRMMHKYEGDDQGESIATLEEVLKMFQHTSIATYTIKFYEQSGDDGIKIKEKTECDGGSFNFKLCENEELYQDARIKRYGASNESALEKRIAALENPARGEDEDDEPQTIGEFLKRPDKVIEWAKAIGEVMALFKPGAAARPVPAYVGTIERIAAKPQPTTVNEKPMEPETQPANQYPQDAQMRLIVAINTLEANDPKILEHLEKLAKISAGNKPLFETLTKTLDAMP